MSGIKTILKKELADYFSSFRFIIVFAIVAMGSLIIVYLAGMNLKQDLEGVVKPQFVFLMLFTSTGAVFSLLWIVAIFGPLVGLILGFDAINRERNEGTLSKLLSQPIYRDAVINGKFLAGVVIIAIMMVSIVLVITGLGLITLGVVPGIEELWRIFIYLIISIIYISFWLGVAILFSIVFRSAATSLIAALAAFLFFSVFILVGAGVVSKALIPDAGVSDLRRNTIERAISLISPLKLYTDSTATIINPTLRTTGIWAPAGMMEQLSISRFSGPLPLSQSILVVLPYIISLLAITVICFAISYTIFMRQEIRSF